MTAIEHDNYPEAYLKQILSEVKTIALVGASPKPERDSYACMQALLKQGYRVYPVNPREVGKQILGQDCYADLETLNGALDQPVDMVRYSAHLRQHLASHKRLSLSRPR